MACNHVMRPLNRLFRKFETFHDLCSLASYLVCCDMCDKTGVRYVKDWWYLNVNTGVVYGVGVNFCDTGVVFVILVLRM